jgi:CRISPR/Cas system Type II protein with McrA/HNH and RuvC-like nuclease domain
MNLGRLFLAQKGLCFHCGGMMAMRPMLNRRRDDDGYTKDHLIPQSAGGRLRGNIVLAHYRCNNRRGDRMPTEEMSRRCEQLWKEAVRPPAKLVKTSLMRMGWGDKRRQAIREERIRKANKP